MGVIIEDAEGKHDQGATFVIFAVDVDVGLLEESLYTTVMVLQHGNVDGRDLPGVLGVNVRTGLKEELHAIEPTVSGSIMKGGVHRGVGVVPL